MIRLGEGDCGKRQRARNVRLAAFTQLRGQLLMIEKRLLGPCARDHKHEAPALRIAEEIPERIALADEARRYRGRADQRLQRVIGVAVGQRPIGFADRGLLCSGARERGGDERASDQKPCHGDLLTVGVSECEDGQQDSDVAGTSLLLRQGPRATGHGPRVTG